MHQKPMIMCRHCNSHTANDLVQTLQLACFETTMVTKRRKIAAKACLRIYCTSVKMQLINDPNLRVGMFYGKTFRGSVSTHKQAMDTSKSRLNQSISTKTGQVHSKSFTTEPVKMQKQII